MDGRTYVTQKDHGYVFEVFPDSSRCQIAEPIKAWGRAVWEGAALSTDLAQAFITEDTGGGLFYRWTAPQGRRIRRGIARQFGENDGILQACQLVRNGKPLVHFGELSAADLDKPYPVRWVDGGEDRQAQKTDLRKQFPGATVQQAAGQGPGRAWRVGGPVLQRLRQRAVRLDPVRLHLCHHRAAGQVPAPLTQY